MTRKLIPFFIAGLFLASCGGSSVSSDNLLPAYTNPTVKPYTDSILNNPDNAQLYFMRAEALSKINNDSLALADVQKARSLDKKNPQYSFTAGYLQLQLDQPAEAVKSLQESMQQSPGNVNTRLLMARAYLALHQADASKQQVDQILAAAPGHPGALLMQAEISASRKDTAAALATLQRLLELDPANYQASYNMADLYSSSNDDRAVSQYQQTFRMDTLDVSPLYDLAAFYEKKKDLVKAKEYYTACILRDHDCTDAYIALGKLFLQEKDNEKALRHFNMAIQSKPQDADAYFMKGKCFETMSQKDSARAAYQQALIFDPSLKEAREGLSRVK